MPWQNWAGGAPAAPLAPALGLAAVLQAPTMKMKTVATTAARLPRARNDPGTPDRLMTTSSLAVPALCRGRLTDGAALKPWIARSVRIDVDRCQRLRSKEFLFCVVTVANRAQSYDR